MDFFATFKDFKKAYDSVVRNSLWEKLKKYGLPTKLIKLTEMCIGDSRAK